MATVAGVRPSDVAVVDGEFEPPTLERDASSAAADGAPAKKLGPLLDETDEGKVAKANKRAWTKQESAISRRKAFWKANRLRRKGKRWVRVTQDTDTATVYVAPASITRKSRGGSSPAIPRSSPTSKGEICSIERQGSDASR